MPLSLLNKEQLDAATAQAGHNLVIASAGTGKTSTIVARIAYLLESGVSPESILLLTFTNKAAGEMISRLKNYFEESVVDRIEAGTFHAVCYRWLKRELPGSILLKQPGELKTLFRSIYEKRNFSRMSLDQDALSANYLYELYSLYQNVSSKGFDEWMLEKYPQQQNLVDIYTDIAEEYEETKLQYGFLSFNDLLIHTKKYLVENDAIFFNEILVDEYQDTNTLQSSLIDSLSSKSLFCVGDYDQSIYAFNGADIGNIASFTDRYPDAKVHNLSINYRSGAPILSLATRVIEKNERIYPKRLRVAKQGKSIAPKLLVYGELFEQYRHIAELISQSDTEAEEIAVIFRNNASADGIEASLREYGIAAKRRGGKSFFDAREVKFIMDMASFALNPRDMMACIHIFEYAKGVGTALAKDIFSCLSHFGKGDPLRGLLSPELFDLPRLRPNKNVQLGLFDDDMEIGSVSRFSEMDLPEEIRAHPLLKHPRINRDTLEFFVHFYNFFKSVKKISKAASFIGKVLESDLYLKVADQLCANRAKMKSGEIDTEKFKSAMERIVRKAQLLRNLAGGYRDLESFMNAMVLKGGELSEGSGINLLTVHASKGLEFHEVYIVDLMDGRFPNRKLMSSSGSLEEERRLFYVAVTRAKEKLYLSFAERDRIKKLDFKPSPFLEEAGLIKIK